MQIKWRDIWCPPASASDELWWIPKTWLNKLLMGEENKPYILWNPEPKKTSLLQSEQCSRCAIQWKRNSCSTELKKIWSHDLCFAQFWEDPHWGQNLKDGSTGDAHDQQRNMGAVGVQSCCLRPAAAGGGAGGLNLLRAASWSVWNCDMGIRKPQDSHAIAGLSPLHLHNGMKNARNTLSYSTRSAGESQRGHTANPLCISFRTSWFTPPKKKKNISLSPQRLDSLASLSSSRLPVPQSELSEFLRQCLRSCSLRAHLFSRQTKGRRRECMSISKTPTWSQIIRIELSGKRRRLSEGGDSRNSFMVGGTTSFFKEQHNFTWQQYLDDEEDEFLLTAFVRLSAPVSGS